MDQLGERDITMHGAHEVVTHPRPGDRDGSTAWCAIIGGGSNIFAGYLPRHGGAEAFADPDRSSATMFAPLGTLDEAADGTLRLDGRWPFVSNCLHAEWIGLGAVLRRDHRAPLGRVLTGVSDSYPPYITAR